MNAKTATLKQHEVSITLKFTIDMTTVDITKEFEDKLDTGWGISYKKEVITREDELDEAIINIVGDVIREIPTREKTEVILDNAEIIKRVHTEKTIKLSELKDDAPKE